VPGESNSKKAAANSDPFSAAPGMAPSSLPKTIFSFLFFCQDGHLQNSFQL
jgi:hypothetical protein